MKVLLEYDGFLSQFFFVVVMNLVYRGPNQTIFSKIKSILKVDTPFIAQQWEIGQHNKIDVWFYFGGCQCIQTHKKNVTNSKISHNM